MRKVHVPFKLAPVMRDHARLRAKLLGHTMSAYLRDLVEKDLKGATGAVIKR